MKALAALLTYPDEVLVAAVPELRETLGSGPLASTLKDSLGVFFRYLAQTDVWTLQEAYVERFDTGRSTSLHLFEHVHGESKDRGQAMVDLMEHYQAFGLTLVPEELPDYLPAFLEFCSLLEPTEAAEFLGSCAPILETLAQRLESAGSPYAAVFPALLSFAAPAGGPLPQVRPEGELDTEWAEAPAFGPLSGGC
jgi:nitrate reductase delta subunit